MKKAKIMFTALTPLAIVGGLLAFKTNSFQAGNVYCLNNFGLCMATVYTTAYNGSPITTNMPCPNLTTFYIDINCLNNQSGFVYDNNQ